MANSRLLGAQTPLQIPCHLWLLADCLADRKEDAETRRMAATAVLFGQRCQVLVRRFA